MKKVDIYIVMGWSLACLGISLVLSWKVFQGGLAVQLPSYLILLNTGLLGMYVGNVLMRMNRQLAVLEGKLAERHPGKSN